MLILGIVSQCQSNHLCEDIEAKIQFSPYVPPDTGGRYKCKLGLALLVYLW